MTIPNFTYTLTAQELGIILNALENFKEQISKHGQPGGCKQDWRPNITALIKKLYDHQTTTTIKSKNMQIKTIAEMAEWTSNLKTNCNQLAETLQKYHAQNEQIHRLIKSAESWILFAHDELMRAARLEEQNNLTNENP